MITKLTAAVITRNEEEGRLLLRNHDLRFRGAGHDGGALPAPQELPLLRGALAVQTRAVRASELFLPAIANVLGMGNPYFSKPDLRCILCPWVDLCTEGMRPDSTYLHFRVMVNVSLNLSLQK